ncbi:MAG: NAD(+) synthase [Myxococcales bacterium]|nr:NAD(+) synthase [Myxococcales bacterium]
MQLLRVGAAALNQTPLDWQGNLARIEQAVAEARRQGVALLCLPELAITGYGCEDAFGSPAVAQRALQMVVDLAPSTVGMVVAVGLPVYCQKALYNCAALLVDGRLVGLVAKQNLAGDGIHYEPRWFKPWPAGQRDTIDVHGTQLPIGDLLFDIGGVSIGFEICEDAWVAARPGAGLAMRGADVILNPSASHFAFGKFAVRQQFVCEGSRAFGVAYVYANLLGNEAGRVIYDGGCMIATGGALQAVGPRLTFRPLELTSAIIDIDGLRRDEARRPSSRSRHDLDAGTITVPFAWPHAATPTANASPAAASWEQSVHLKHEEFTRAVSLGLWDYLRKSRAGGYVISLSGGADSATCAAMVHSALALAHADLGAAAAAAAVAHAPALSGQLARGDVQAATSAALTCAYQATANSSETTRAAAEAIAHAVGATYLELNVEHLVSEYRTIIATALDRQLTWARDDIALQNIQARVRAPSVWMLANLAGAILITTSNRSEAAVGYATMDGDMAGGLAPLGGIDKSYLREYLRWREHDAPLGLTSLPALSHINRQAPTAELRPAAATQTDEADLMPYDVLEAIEDLAIRDKYAPREVLTLLAPQFPSHRQADLVAWITRFFTLWARNQWKRERMAPSFHLDDRNVDPRSWCRFPILSGGFASELAELATAP